jgi:hypothetical protein
VRFVAEHEAAAHNAHNVRADGLGLRNSRHHLFVRRPVLSALESVGMTPRIDAVQLVFIQLRLQILEPRVVGLGREEAGLQ